MNDFTETSNKNKNITDLIENIAFSVSKNFNESINENNDIKEIENKENINTNKENEDKIFNIVKKEENISNSPSIHLEHFKDLAIDSFCNSFNNTFCVFESINQIFYLIYGTQNFSIISYSLIQFQKTNEIKNAHCSNIIGFRHYCDKKNKRDLIISISAKDNNIKLWDINNFELLLDFQNIYKNGFINSACFLNSNSDIYIITSNSNFIGLSEPIKVYDLNGNLVQFFDTENENIFFVDVYYDKILSMNFIISCGFEYVKSYDFNGGILYNKYLEVEKYRYNCALVDDNENEIKLIAPNTLGDIIIWNFHSGEKISKIKIRVDDNIIYNICHWNNNYYAIGGDFLLKIIDIKNNENHKDLINSNNFIRTIKKIIHPYYGECLIVQGACKSKITMWTLKHF